MTDRQRIAFIVPYFGKLPNYFKFWNQSTKANKNVEIFFFTDIEEPENIGDNFHWVKMTFEEVRQRAQKLVDFKISLNEPYKLVDFKPAYGAMFGDYIKDYSYWAFGDIDTIWGDLNIILDRVNEGYDKLLDLGHLTIIKNNDQMNYLWKKHVSSA